MRDFLEKVRERIYTLFGPYKRKKTILVGCTIAAAAVCVVLLSGMNNALQTELIVDDMFAVPADVVEEVIEEYVDEFELALSTGEYSATVLGITADAGVGYVTDTLFIGDSNTEGMLNHGSVTNVTMDNGIGIISMGISHVTSLRCVKFSGMEAVPVPEAVKILQPRRILINYGTNDYYMSPEKFVATYREAIEAIQAAYPYTDIIIGSIFPITANCSYYTVNMQTIDQFNLELVKLAKEKNLKFLNWTESLKDPGTGYCKPEYMSGDGVHLSRNGMEQLFEYFRTHSFDSDDRRPKPLNPIPFREPTPRGLLGVGVTPKAPDPPADEGFVTVTFAAGTGGSLSMGGGSSGSFTMQLPPGGTAGPVTAHPSPGYIFKGWTGAASSGGQSLTFTVPSGAKPGDTFVMTAIFEAEPPVEPPVDPPPVDPPPVDPPPVDPPPVDPPPVDPPPVVDP